MKAGATSINTHLAGVVTSLAECYKIERKDGTVLGFTGHDEEIIYDGVTYRPSLSVSRSAISSNQEFSVDNLELNGIIDSTYVTDEDLLGEKYDGAEIFAFAINFVTPSQGIIKLRRGNLGNITYEQGMYKAEVRGLIQRLNKKILRTFSPECDAEFGVSVTGCGFDLTSVQQTGAVGTVTDRRSFAISGVTISSATEFVNGRITFTSGSNNGLTLEIKSCSVAGAVTLFLKAPFTVTAADTFTIVPGCAHSLAACQSFGQTDNFRGFPYIKGQKDLNQYETGNL